MPRPIKVCVACRRKKPSPARGLCEACYEVARRSVNDGSTTWAVLEELKLAKPLFKSPFRAAMAASTHTRKES